MDGTVQQPQRVCIFCGATGKLTAEHVWPAWLDDHIPTPPGPSQLGYRNRHGTSDGSVEVLFDSRRLDQRARTVCLSCNNGWMSRLESAAIPYVKEMVAGRQIGMDRDAQRVVAAWSVKTGLCVERTFPHATRAVPDEYYALLFSDPSLPPADVAVWVGHYAGASPHGISHRSWPLWQFVRRQPSKMFQVTYRIGYLVARVVAATPDDDVAFVNNPSPSLLQLWPAMSKELSWPPELAFDDETFELLSAVQFPTE